MKASRILATLAATALVFASGAAIAQGQQGSQQGSRQQGGGQQGGQQQMQQQQKRQAERAMSQDRTMDQERLQTRERTQDRTQAQTQTQTQTQTQAQAHAAQGAGTGIYGGNLMTVQERNQYRAELGAFKTDEERLQYQARHREQMELRAKQRGVDPQVTDD